ESTDPFVGPGRGGPYGQGEYFDRSHERGCQSGERLAYRVFLFREYVDGRVGREVGTLVSSEIHFCQREGETDAFYRGRDEVPGSGVRVENDRENEGYFVC